MTEPALDNDRLLSPSEAARLLGWSERTLENKRLGSSEGPPYVRLSHRCVRYRLGTLREYIAARTYSSTAAEHAAGGRP